MIPQRRFSVLLEQAREYQRQRCIYHNPRPETTFSLYADHRCSKYDFPQTTTTILEVHTDEVWNIAWSHDGNYLASASKDKSAIIWRRDVRFLRLPFCHSPDEKLSPQIIPPLLRSGLLIIYFVITKTQLAVWHGLPMIRFS